MIAVLDRSRVPEVPVVAALALLAVVTAGPRPLLAGLLWLAAVTPRLIDSDLAEHRLPDALVLPGYPVVLAALVLDEFASGGSPMPAVLMGVHYGLLLLLLHVIGGMGFGDVKLAPLLGVLTSATIPGGGVLAVVLAFAIGGVCAVVVLVRRGLGARLAFGPPMLLGAWASVALLA